MAFKDKEREHEYNQEYYKKNREQILEQQKEYRSKPEIRKHRSKINLEREYRLGLKQPMDKNKECASYLGVFVAERVLSKVFKNVKRMPNNNPGFDFICNKGYKIDVKSGCLSEKDHKKNYRWVFRSNQNQIADYFLCLAFNNREELNPQHIWLIPSEVVKDKKSFTIVNNEKSLQKWKQYELDEKLEKVITCCNVLKAEV